MGKHKPDYKLIDELEHELYPEWFEGEGGPPPSGNEPLPPPTPPPPPRRRAPGREEEVRFHPGARIIVDDHDAIHPYNGVTASSVAGKIDMEHVAFYGMNLRRVKIYGPNGDLL